MSEQSIEELQCRCNQPVDVNILDKITSWTSNYLVIIIIGLILFILVTMILYYLRPAVVLDNSLEDIDNARLILSSFIIASVLLIVAWGLTKYALTKFSNAIKEE